MVYRNNPNYEVIAFTATQIPGISNRVYPKELAGKLYPKGIPIVEEEKLEELIKKYKVDEVVFSYSDVSHEYVMHKASIALANGASFVLLGPEATMLKSKKPVIAITAVRTGAGKSPTSRKVCEILRKKGKKVMVIRHPMPYGNLKEQICQRFEKLEDLDVHNCTIEEREEYEPFIEMGVVVYSGVDFEKILRQAEKEADIIVWDGGNNDFPFIKPDLHIVVADAKRPGHEVKYHPGETNLRRADVVIINKVRNIKSKSVEIIRRNVKTVNPKARIIYANLIPFPERIIKGKKVLAIEDGPTLTHGELATGVAYFVAKKFGCKVIDPRKYAVGSIREVYRKYKHLGKVLPAVGYNRKQIEELQKTINKAKCEAIIIGTPIDLRKFIKINKPSIRVKYELKEIGRNTLEKIIDEWLSDNYGITKRKF
jgi:predicted GTPase